MAGPPFQSVKKGKNGVRLWIKADAVSLSKILFDKLKKHFQNFHESSENAMIENERHP